MNELVQLQNLIKTLQKEAADLKARDFNATVKEIQLTMQLFGITAKDLHMPQRSPRKIKGQVAAGKNGKSSSSPATGPSKPVIAKYIGPEGQTWSGRGLSPKWLASLISQGAKREDFLIQKQPTESA
jgi:DNA-binding protein H-NS